MSDKFLKFDTEKNRLELIEPEFIEGIGKILTYGAEKYAAWNWRKVNSQEDLDRIKGATMRHMMAYMKGEKNDPETNLSHLYHMACNLMFLDYFDRNGLRADPNVVEDITDERFEAEVNEAISREQGVIDRLRGSKYVLLSYNMDGGLVISTSDFNSQWFFDTYDEFVTWADSKLPKIIVQGDKND